MSLQTVEMRLSIPRGTWSLADSAIMFPGGTSTWIIQAEAIFTRTRLWFDGELIWDMAMPSDPLPAGTTTSEVGGLYRESPPGFSPFGHVIVIEIEWSISSTGETGTSRCSARFLMDTEVTGDAALALGATGIAIYLATRKKKR